MKGMVSVVLSAVIMGCGSQDRVPDYNQAVVHIENVDSQGYCSGSLVSPNLVLTARHCVSSLKQRRGDCASNRFLANVEPQQLRVVFTSPGSSELQLNKPLESHFAYARMVLTPDVDDDSTCGRDIAAIVLDHAIPVDIAKPLALRLDPDAQSGGTVEMIGFGVSPADVLRTRTSSVGSISCVRDRCGVKTANSEFMSGVYGCSGDSGGPLLDPEQKLLGVISSMYVKEGNRCSTYIVAVSAPYYKDFIEESLDIASSL